MSCYYCAISKPYLACSYNHVRVVKRTRVVLSVLTRNESSSEEVHEPLNKYVFDPLKPKVKFFTLRGRWE